MKRLACSLLMMMSVSGALMADEGMWLLKDITPAARAVVSIGFYGTGSMISDEGLLITNHHVAYSDVFSISTPQKNYLEEGFWARSREEEIPIPGKEFFFLDRMKDVTAEVDSLIQSLQAQGQNAGSRRITFLMEKKYSGEPGIEVSLNSMWSGKQYIMYFYRKYTDVRLVAAPPVQISAFGGDEDNWEWPQHKCDFAMYRVYTAPDGSPAAYSPHNVPMKPASKLEISTKGYREGSRTTVIGFPGRTNRYSSSMEVDFMSQVQLPITTSIRKDQMEIMRRWMDADPEIRLKYSDMFFSLSNVQELQEGELACFNRFGVVREKQDAEKALLAWIASTPGKQEEYGSLLDDIKSWYDRNGHIERNRNYFRETISRGTNISRILMRVKNSRGDVATQKAVLEKGLAELDMRVEKDLLRYTVETFLENIDPSYYGDWHKELISRFGKDYSAMTDYLWDGSVVSSPEKIKAFAGQDGLEDDLVFKFLRSTSIGDIVGENGWILRQTELQRNYRHAMYEMNAQAGRPQYPDANSTMRISYGKVSPLRPWDAVYCDWYSTPEGILQKSNPVKHDFAIGDTYRSLLDSRDWGRWGHGRKKSMMNVDFLTDNDITGGNSGSPVLDSKGRLIGLAFDGNKESLASDCSFTDGYNKCVCVDIRYILFILEKYAGMDYIIKEIGL